MSEELAKIEDKKQDVVDLPSMMAMAKTLIDSRFLPEAIKTPPQAVAIMLTGRELGIPVMQALRQINVIKGKPTMSAELMLSMAYKHVPGFKYQIIESTTKKCVCKFERPGHAPLTHEFNMEDAKALGLDGKDNWKKQPATMLRWRCISSGLRLVVPDAIAGVYTPEEITPDGGVIEVEAEAQEESQDKTEPVDVISDKQRIRLFAKLNAANMSEDKLRNYLKKQFQLDHTTDIKRKDYDGIYKWIESGGKTEKPDAEWPKE